MRRIPRLAMSILLAATACAVSLCALVCGAAIRVGSMMRETFRLAAEFVPRLVRIPAPARRIWMAATALNNRLLGGVRLPGQLGQPTVRMLTG